MGQWNFRLGSLEGSLGPHSQPQPLTPRTQSLGCTRLPSRVPELTSVNSPTRCKFSKPETRSYRQGEMRVSAPDLTLLGPPVSPSRHPYPPTSVLPASLPNPGKVSNQGISRYAAPPSPSTLPVLVWVDWGKCK